MSNPLRAATFFLLALAASLQAEGTIIIDDEALSANFEQKLSRIAARGKSLSSRAAHQATVRCHGDRIALPKYAPPPAQSGEESLYRRCAPAVVAIGSVYKCDKCDDWHQDGFASGWIVSPTGLIVTNAHVFQPDSTDRVGVMTQDGEVFAIQEILASNTNGDATVFRIDTGGKTLHCLPIARTASPGEDVTIISHPMGRFYCLTTGKISRFHREKNAQGDTSTWMSVTADFAAGSSGGPVLNARGEVVGMVSSTLTAYSENAENSQEKDTHGSEVQMIFKDCVPLEVIRALFKP